MDEGLFMDTGRGPWCLNRLQRYLLKWPQVPYT